MPMNLQHIRLKVNRFYTIEWLDVTRIRSDRLGICIHVISKHEGCNKPGKDSFQPDSERSYVGIKIRPHRLILDNGR